MSRKKKFTKEGVYIRLDPEMLAALKADADRFGRTPTQSARFYIVAALLAAVPSETPKDTP